MSLLVLGVEARTCADVHSTPANRPRLPCCCCCCGAQLMQNPHHTHSHTTPLGHARSHTQHSIQHSHRCSTVGRRPGSQSRLQSLPALTTTGGDECPSCFQRPALTPQQVQRPLDVSHPVQGSAPKHTPGKMPDHKSCGRQHTLTCIPAVCAMGGGAGKQHAHMHLEANMPLYTPMGEPRHTPAPSGKLRQQPSRCRQSDTLCIGTPHSRRHTSAASSHSPASSTHTYTHTHCHA